MMSAMLQRLVRAATSDEDLRRRLLADPVGTLNAFGLTTAEIAKTLSLLLAGALRIEGVESKGAHILSPWPPPGAQDHRVDAIEPMTAEVGKEFSFTVTGAGFEACDKVAFRNGDDSSQFVAFELSFYSSEKMVGKALIDKADTYDVIVGNVDHFGFRPRALIVT